MLHNITPTLFPTLAGEINAFIDVFSEFLRDNEIFRWMALNYKWRSFYDFNALFSFLEYK